MRMVMIRFHFEDDGQDFLWWDVEDMGDGIGKVVDAGPLQAWAWASGNHYVNLAQPHGVGDKLVTTDDLARSQATGYSRVLEHRVTRVECISEPAGEA
ncbi:Hypothetical protein OINT_1001786 [Brucella intermedia LMG 3301]|uniref:Uncharacterized protein n=2 Tax=Brucella intermedia TaxID=94625 RepID=C4WG52_9HYPH|nr:Hypothetical protein OINT_1001786 [Brucella intermedia LMG 3301]